MPQEKNAKICNIVPRACSEKHGAMATFEQISGNTAIGKACQLGRLAFHA
jgi:hypothetical protein